MTGRSLAAVAAILMSIGPAVAQEPDGFRSFYKASHDAIRVGLQSPPPATFEYVRAVKLVRARFIDINAGPALTDLAKKTVAVLDEEIGTLANYHLRVDNGALDGAKSLIIEFRSNLKMTRALLRGTVGEKLGDPPTDEDAATLKKFDDEVNAKKAAMKTEQDRLAAEARERQRRYDYVRGVGDELAAKIREAKLEAVQGALNDFTRCRWTAEIMATKLTDAATIKVTFWPAESHSKSEPTAERAKASKLSDPKRGAVLFDAVFVVDGARVRFVKLESNGRILLPSSRRIAEWTAFLQSLSSK